MALLRATLWALQLLAVAGVLLAAVGAARSPERPLPPAMVHGAAALLVSGMLLLLLDVARTPPAEAVLSAMALAALAAVVVTNRAQPRTPVVASAVTGLALFHATLTLLG